jgi:hypothetical protein
MCGRQKRSCNDNNLFFQKKKKKICKKKLQSKFVCNVFLDVPAKSGSGKKVRMPASSFYNYFWSSNVHQVSNHCNRIVLLLFLNNLGLRKFTSLQKAIADFNNPIAGLFSPF